jgi:hypothetical protein
MFYDELILYPLNLQQRLKMDFSTCKMYVYVFLSTFLYTSQLFLLAFMFHLLVHVTVM